MTQTLCNEISAIENDSNFSLTQLVSNLHRTEGRMAYQGEQLQDRLAHLEVELKQARGPAWCPVGTGGPALAPRGTPP